MKLQGRKLLVTGADGFIGSHLVEELVRQGARVRAFIYYNSFGHNGWLDSLDKSVRSEIEFFNGDIRDPYGTKTAMRGMEAVFHLAALIGIPYSYHSPDSYVDTNIKGTLNVLQAARELELAQVIHTSTSEVYGSARIVPISEEHPLQGQSPYAATKIGADQLALSFYRSFDLPVSVIRPFNTYGPRQSLRAIIPTVISQLVKGGERVQVGSVTPTRDFTFVGDTVRGFISALGNSGTIGQVINIGSGFEISILRTVQLIGQLMGKKVVIDSESKRIRPEESEVNRLYADTTKAVQLLSWPAKELGEAGFRSGLKRTIDWFSEPDNIALYKSTGYLI